MLERFSPDHPVLHTPAIWHPDAPRDDWAVVWFESTIHLTAPLEEAALWVSASQRFELYLHTQDAPIARGPSRSDPDRWGAVRVELPRLEAGKNVLRARVWHAGPHSGMAQMGPKAFFLACPEPEELVGWRTDAEHWTSSHIAHWLPLKERAWGDEAPYDVVGAGELVDKRIPIEKPVPAKQVARIPEDDWGNVPLGCLLRPEPLPHMRETPATWQRIAQASDNIRDAAEQWFAGENTLTIPANTAVSITLDHGTIVNGYLQLDYAFWQGSAQIDLITAEAPSIGVWHNKPPRDQTEGVQYRGHLDRVITGDAGINGALQAIDFLALRSFRYLQLNITTSDTRLELRSVGVTSSQFPFDGPTHTAIEGDGLPDMSRILDACDRTIDLCAHDLLFDCPHFEQCQFPGDARLQALYHYAIYDEDRLALKAIDDFHASRLADGMLQCRWPSTKLQILPTFALQWIGMLHDAMLWRNPPGLERYLPVARGVIEWFLAHQRSDGLLGRIPNAPFVDWSPGFHRGNAPQDADGGSSILTLMLASACRELNDLEAKFGHKDTARYLHNLYESLGDAVLDHCWDYSRRMLADTPTKQSFSIHAQCEAIRAGILSDQFHYQLLADALADDSLIAPGSYYYRHYVFEAARLSRKPEIILDGLHDWQNSLDTHRMDTLPETDRDHPRSDCHAWGAMPAYHLTASLLGLRPEVAASGERVVRFDPQPAHLTRLQGRLPAAGGWVTAEMNRAGDAWQARVSSPTPLILGSGDTIRLERGTHTLNWPTQAGIEAAEIS